MNEIESNIEPNNDELNDSVAEAASDAAIGAVIAADPDLAGQVEAQAQDLSNAVQVFGQGAEAAAISNNAEQIAANIVQNPAAPGAYDVVPQPSNSYQAGPVPDGNYGQIVLRDASKVPFGGVGGRFPAAAAYNSQYAAGPAPDPAADPAPDPTAQQVAVGQAAKYVQLEIEANPGAGSSNGFAGCLQSRCVKLTAVGVGLVGVGLAVYFAKFFNAGQTAQATTPPVKPPVPTAAPPVPLSLEARPQDQSSILLSWVTAEGATEYVVKRDGVVLKTTNPIQGNSFTDTGLAAASTHTYTVAAKNAAGTSADSAAVSATTLKAPPPAPAVPTGLTGVSLFLDKVCFSWLASDGATSYTIKRRLVSDTNFTTVATVPSQGILRMAYNDTGLAAATQYCYTASATNAAGTSADAGFICITTQDALDQQAKEIVAQFNTLDEPTFWSLVIAWLNADNPSFLVQFSVAQYWYSIVNMSAPAVLTPLSVLEAEADSLVAAYQAPANNKNTLTIYQTLATLTTGRATAVNRYEKINLLIRVLALIMASAPPTPRRMALLKKYGKKLPITAPKPAKSSKPAKSKSQTNAKPKRSPKRK